MTAQELIKILQNHHPNTEVYLQDSGKCLKEIDNVKSEPAFFYKNDRLVICSE